MQQDKQEKRILILGGTNFMGKTLLDGLARSHPGATVVCVNRGKIYWNNEARTQHPEVHNFYCDRREHNDTTATIAFLSRHCHISPECPWDLVVDFCAFRWRDVQSATKALVGIARLYVFISSDSIYNNSPKPDVTPIEESHFDLEKEYKRVKALKNRKDIDKYGYNKLKGEIYLDRIKPLPYVCLRLPDVVGPFDNTERMWCTVRWVKESQQYPLTLTAQEEYDLMSLVDSESVAAQIIRLVDGPLPPSTAYNLAWTEAFTLKSFLDTIGDAVNEDVQPRFKSAKGGDSNQFFPSVECGAISSQRAINQIGWNPLPMKESVRRATAFFLQQAYNYAAERRDMQKEFKRKIIRRAQ